MTRFLGHAIPLEKWQFRREISPLFQYFLLLYINIWRLANPELFKSENCNVHELEYQNFGNIFCNSVKIKKNKKKISNLATFWDVKVHKPIGNCFVSFSMNVSRHDCSLKFPAWNESNNWKKELGGTPKEAETHIGGEALERPM